MVSGGSAGRAVTRSGSGAAGRLLLARVVLPLVLGALVSLPLPLANGAAPEIAGLRVLIDDFEGRTTFVQIGDAEAYPAADVEGLAPYALLLPGVHTVSLLRAPAEGAGGPDLVNAAAVEVELVSGTYYSLLVSYTDTEERVASVAVSQRVESVLLHDELTNLPPAGRARVRIVHATPLAGAFDVELRRLSGADDLAGADDEDPAPSDAEGSESEDDAQRMEVRLEPLAASEPHDVLPGRHDLSVRQAGEEGAARPPMTFDLRAGVSYTFFVTRVGPEELVARLAVDAAIPAPPHVEGE